MLNQSNKVLFGLFRQAQTRYTLKHGPLRVEMTC